ncbi:hypothetical protein LMH87_007399 [Akanthomyces muscarius]|uniref:Uncharacterized protein n=1 Tax=Akanthomyces muscarius TaxID=2231603 RepID=A0A9W8QPL8_AKAMU|nr:hypothetical protein LMH87_007399 [Akanthomyces muscarius]KAJ4165783.1 hypothetical protein LMH87_007399 [Akanthomyces muscarius]
MDNAAVPFSEVKARASIQRRRLPLSRKSLLKFPSGLIPIYLQAQQKWIGLRIKRPTSHIQQSIQNIISYMHNIRLLKLVCLADSYQLRSIQRASQERYRCLKPYADFEVALWIYVECQDSHGSSHTKGDTVRCIQAGCVTKWKTLFNFIKREVEMPKN